jgi:hypothetical protein
MQREVEGEDVAAIGGDPLPYEPPAIVWEEGYEPVGFGVSCAKQEGNPGCFPGPIFS